MANWLFKPNSMKEKLVFSTDVRQTPEGEYRDARHDTVRLLEYQYLCTPAEAMEMEQVFRENPLSVWSVPIWPDATWYVGDIGLSDTTISGVTGDYRSPGAVLMTRDAETLWTKVSVSDYADGYITLSGPIWLATWYGVTPISGVGTAWSGTDDDPFLIVPMLECYAIESLTMNLRSTVTEVKIVFRVTSPKDVSPAELMYATHEGEQVLVDSDISVSNVRADVFRSAELLDSGFGAIAYEDNRDILEKRSIAQLVDYTHDDIWEAHQFLSWARGRDQAWWLPSWRHDIPLTAGASGGATAVLATVPGDASEFVGRSVQLIADDGTLMHKKITSAGSTFLGFSSGLESSISVGAMVSIMNLVRFDTDEFEIGYRFIENGLYATMRASVLEVPE